MFKMHSDSVFAFKRSIFFIPTENYLNHSIVCIYERTYSVAIFLFHFYDITCSLKVIEKKIFERKINEIFFIFERFGTDLLQTRHTKHYTFKNIYQITIRLKKITEN